MRSITQIKSLGDVRTTISTHARAAPPRKGSTHLEVYLLDKERERLETELAVLAKRQRRIEGRLRESQEAMEKLVATAHEEPPGPHAPASAARTDPTAEGGGSDPRQWRRMTVDY